MLLRASQGAIIVCSKVPTENKEKKYEEWWGCFLEKINECVEHSGGAPESEHVIN